MLSKHGSLYFFGCHMLATILQLYDDLRYNYSYFHWSSEYERVIGWLIEEIVFPAEYEKIEDDEHLSLEDFGEVAGDTIYSVFVKKLQSKSKPSEAIISGDAATYNIYCLAVLDVLKHFDTLCTSDEMNNVEYQQHYLTDKTYFEDLAKAINESLKDGVFQLKRRVYPKLELRAKALGAAWNAQLQAEISKYQGKLTNG